MQQLEWQSAGAKWKEGTRAGENMRLLCDSWRGRALEPSGGKGRGRGK